MTHVPLTCADIDLENLRRLLARYGLQLELVADGAPIPGSWFGEPEAGLIGNRVIVRRDTPVHSALHESCHVVCMDGERRARLHTDAAGDYDEENGVNYLQLLLADQLPELGRERLFRDMDEWGYTFRLGSARAWFEQDADDARLWLQHHGIIDSDGVPTFSLRA